MVGSSVDVGKDNVKEAGSWHALVRTILTRIWKNAPDHEALFIGTSLLETKL